MAETCNCVSIELLNSQLTQLGQTLWISNYPCGGPSTVSQVWSAYPYDMFPAGPTIYICTNLFIGSHGIFALEPNCSWIVELYCATIAHAFLNRKYFACIRPYVLAGYICH